MSWYTESGKKDDFVLSTRARLARNLKGFKFTSAMTFEESEKAAKLIETALEPILKSFDKIDISSCSEEEKGVLCEKHLISPNFKNGRLKRIAYVAKDMSSCIMVNEEDHLRIQSFTPGFDPDKALDECGKIETLLRERLDFAYNDKYGYLTACPTNCGTALRLSAMVHLPALAMTGGESQMLRESAKLGMTVRGVYGEGSEAPGGIYQISNQITLGVSVNDICEKFTVVVNAILSAEENLRNKIKTSLSDALHDKICRAEGTLKSAYLMSSEEFINLQSLIRLGKYIGITDIDLTVLKKLWIETLPYTLGAKHTPQERDKLRAEKIRNILSLK